MKRFFIFPMGLALIFLQWRFVSMLEFLLMIWPDYSARNPQALFGESYLSFALAFDELNSLLVALIVPNVLAGLVWALFDYFKYRPHDETCVRFACNLFWCWLYGTILIASGGALLWGIQLYHVQANSRAPIAISLFAIGLCFVINGVSPTFAVAETLTTKFVVSPRALLTKLRGRARWN